MYACICVYGVNIDNDVVASAAIAVDGCLLVVPVWVRCLHRTGKDGTVLRKDFLVACDCLRQQRRWSGVGPTWWSISCNQPRLLGIFCYFALLAPLLFGRDLRRRSLWIGALNFDLKLSSRPPIRWDF